MLRRAWATRPTFALTAVAVACALFLLADVKNRRFQMVDYQVFHVAAARALAGENLYRTGYGPGGDGFYEYKYGPTAAFYFAPLQLLPLAAAKVAYWLLLTAVITANLLLAYRLARPAWRDDPPAQVNRVVLLAALATAVHFFLELHLGQVNQVLLLLFLLAAQGFAAGRPLAFALPAALSLFLKPFALIFVPYLVLRRRHRELAALGGLALLLGALPALRYGGDGLAGQLRGWGARIGEEMAKKQELLAAKNHTLASLLARYTPLRLLADDAGRARALQLLAVALLAGAVLWFVRRGRDLERPEAGDFALLLLCVPLLAFTNYNAFGAALPAAVLVLLAWPRLGPWRWAAGAGLILVGGNWYDLWGKRLHVLIDGWSLVAVGAVILGAALLRGRALRAL